ncbi:hypothetical protein LOCC1_G008415 [Lachnellula occidentalis]|uniref:F-box domain-containing protein n=1 Tax=Lachnellula occidentalis TaxID=215460 RepID=A0A8H8RPD2_9HELO|nr:hypothetical protein LOCC1_G008415 [Lachnellula occidentalis]
MFCSRLHELIQDSSSYQCLEKERTTPQHTPIYAISANIPRYELRGSTSQSAQPVVPAGITWAHFPPEVQFHIFKEALYTEGAIGRGAPNIARLSLVCKDWRKEIQSRRARYVAAVSSLPNPTSTSASPPSDVDSLESSLRLDDPDPEYLESDDNDASDTNSDSEHHMVTQVVKEHKRPSSQNCHQSGRDERNLKEPRKKGEGNLPPFLVRQILVWRDLEHSWNCIANNQVRAIFVEFVKKMGVRPVSRNVDVAHRVFENIRKEMVLVLVWESGFESQLQWLRFSVSVWSGI